MNDSQVAIFEVDRSSLPPLSVTFNKRILYCHGRWSQSSDRGNDVELTDALNACSNISGQMETLIARTELDDAGIRSRFFLCDAIEALLEVSLMRPLV